MGGWLIAMIETVTLRVPSLPLAVAAYHALGYRNAEYGECDAARVALSDPTLQGCPQHTILMSEAPLQTLTLVEWDGAIATPFSAPGWSAMEVLVMNLDALYAELPEGFTVLNPPAALSLSDAIRAMQVTGPAGELIYFTEVSGEVPGFDLPIASRQINHCFVMVNAVTNIARSIEFYARLLACPAPEPTPARVSILSRTHGLDEDHRHDIAPIALGSGQLFELDQWVDHCVTEAAPLPCGWHSLALRRSGPPPASIVVNHRHIDNRLACYEIHPPDGERIDWLCAAA